MALYKRIIFIGKTDTIMAPMAAALMRTSPVAAYMEIESRGIVSLFPEPLNEKAKAVLVRNGIRIDRHASRQLTDEDFSEDNLLLAMTKQQYSDIVDRFSDNENLFSLSSFIMASGDIPDPFGGPISAYAECFDVIRDDLDVLTQILLEREQAYDEVSNAYRKAR